MKLDIKDKVCYATTKEYGEVEVIRIDFEIGRVFFKADFSNDGDGSYIQETSLSLDNVISIEFV